MPAGAAIVGVGAYSAYQGGKQAKDAQRMNEQAIAMERERLAFDRERYDDWQASYGGLQGMMIEDAERGVRADLDGVTGRASADVIQAFDRARQMEARNQQRYGVINPTSGRFNAGQRGIGLAQAAAHVGAVGQSREAERRWADDATYQRRQNAMAIGQGLNPAGDVRSSMGSVAGAYGNQAAMHNQTAGALYGNAGQMFGYGLMQL